MRSTKNYSRKRRISRRSLRGGRKSIRRKSRKSVRRGRKSLRRGRRSLRGGANEADFNGTEDPLNTLLEEVEEEEEAEEAEEEEKIDSMGEKLEKLSDTPGRNKAETVGSKNILLRRYSKIFYNGAEGRKKYRLDQILEFIKTKLNTNMLDISDSLTFPTDSTPDSTLARDMIVTKLNTAETATKVCTNETYPHQYDDTCINTVFQQDYASDIKSDQLFFGYENIESRGRTTLNVPLNKGKSKFYIYSNLFTDTKDKLFKIKCSINRYRGKGHLVWNSKLKIRPVNFTSE